MNRNYEDVFEDFAPGKPKAFNSDVVLNFHEVTRDERLAADAGLDLLISQTKRQLNECE